MVVVIKSFLLLVFFAAGANAVVNDTIQEYIDRVVEEISNLAQNLEDDSYECSRTCLAGFLTEAAELITSEPEVRDPENILSLFEKMRDAYLEGKACMGECPDGELKNVIAQLGKPSDYLFENLEVLKENLQCILSNTGTVVNRTQGYCRRRLDPEGQFTDVNQLTEALKNPKGISREFVGKYCSYAKCSLEVSTYYLARENCDGGATFIYEITKKQLRAIAFYSLKRLELPEDVMPVECGWFWKDQ